MSTHFQSRLHVRRFRHDVAVAVVLVSLMGGANRYCFAQDESTESRWWNASVDAGLEHAGENRDELIEALTRVPETQREGMAFLIANMPAADAQTLTAEFLLTDVNLAYQARENAPWGNAYDDDVFLNDVLPYANLDEPREAWRENLAEICRPIVAECKTTEEAALAINRDFFPAVKTGYSTQRRRANQSPSESIEQGRASCTGLSILLADACRSVGVPARVVGTPLWTIKTGNHNWVEIWHDGAWHFLGAAEPDDKGLNYAWFITDAMNAQADVPEHAIYAASFRKTETHFPLVWAPDSTAIPAINVTRFYNELSPDAATFRLMLRAVDAQSGQRVACEITVTDTETDEVFIGSTPDAGANVDDWLIFVFEDPCTLTVSAEGVDETIDVEMGQQSQVLLQVPIPTGSGSAATDNATNDEEPQPDERGASESEKE